jgi:hypothetical protein
MHARPHLETHSRSLGHSAVAGAAYRLGLQLYDEKAGVMRDFRKRKLGEEIVLALTVAPKGAPSWATDPAQLWNRVEAAETRKDAQLARDYRIPIPFHLTDEQAGQLSTDMAMYIAEELFTPVSIGLHRDADLDAQGLPKPNDKQGFHAHLYFPTRALADLDGSDSSSRSGSASGSGFGAKLTILSNKRTSVAFVEAMNAKWAMLANQYASTTGLTADYDHRSYKRMGLNLTPTPSMGRHAVAMERKGIPTWKGDRLREAQVMAKVFERAHSVSQQAQHAQAVADVAREKGKPAVKSGLLVPSGLKTTGGMAQTKRAPSVGEPRFISVLQGGTTLAERIRNMGPAPTTWAERETLERLLEYINMVERCCAMVDEYEREKAKLERQREREKAAELEAEFQASQSRGYRSRVYVQVKDWEKQHPWRVKVASMAGPNAKHEDLKRLQSQLQIHDRHVQTFKASASAHRSSADDAGKGIATVTIQIVEQEAKLVHALRDVAGLKPDLLENLPALMPVAQREVVREAIDKVRAVVRDVISARSTDTECINTESTKLPSPKFKS